MSDTPGGKRLAERCGLDRFEPCWETDGAVTLAEDRACVGCGFKPNVTPPEDRVSLDLSRNEVFWLASCHMLTVIIADGRPPSAVQEAYRIMKQNGQDLGTEGINELYTRISMLVQAKWPDSTTFVFADAADEQRDFHGENTRSDPNVS